MTKKTASDIKEELEKTKINESKHIIVRSSCILCKHDACHKLTEIYYENDSSIDIAKKWFEEKFKSKKSFAEKTWIKHFKEHVEPFVKGYQVVRQKKLDDVMERAAQAKRANQVDMTTTVRQMVFDLILDAYSYKPNEIKEKEDINKWTQLVKTVTPLMKVYNDMHKVELEMLAFGKSEDEQKKILSNYASGMIKDMMRALSDMPDAQKRLSSFLSNPDNVAFEDDE